MIMIMTMMMMMMMERWGSTFPPIHMHDESDTRYDEPIMGSQHCSKGTHLQPIPSPRPMETLVSQRPLASAFAFARPTHLDHWRRMGRGGVWVKGRQERRMNE